MGSSPVLEEVECLYNEGIAWIKRHIGQTDLFLNLEKEQRKQNEMEEPRRVLDNVEYILINGTEQILDRVYRQIGFDRIKDDILRQLFIARFIPFCIWKWVNFINVSK